MTALEIVTTMSLHDGILYSLHYHKLLAYTLISLLLFASAILLRQSIPVITKVLHTRKQMTKEEIAQSIPKRTVVNFSVGIALIMWVSYTCVTFLVTFNSYTV